MGRKREITVLEAVGALSTPAKVTAKMIGPKRMKVESNITGVVKIRLPARESEYVG